MAAIYCFSLAVLQIYIFGRLWRLFPQPWPARIYLQPLGVRPDEQFRRLLRSRRKRLCDRRAAEKRDELAPLHVLPQVQETASYRFKRAL